MRPILSLIVTLCAISTTALADSPELISSSEVTIKPSRITERVVLAHSVDDALRVQAIAAFEEGATDFSNTTKIILSISQLGEMGTVEANFVIGNSIGLDSAVRLAPGVYELKYIDASKGMDWQVRTIDAKKALSDIKNSNCAEFETCTVETTVTVGTETQFLN